MDFKAWLKREIIGVTFNTANLSKTTRVALGRSYLIYPIYSDGKEFVHCFGNVLQFRLDVGQLATEVIASLLRNKTPRLGKGWYKWDLYSNFIVDMYLAAH